MTESIASFRRKVWSHYRAGGRYDLPWRKTRNTYKILVSEMMLQQTQVSRVIPKYRAFLKRFPTAHVLAKAPLSEVLKEWSGLGYNRRAKYLHDAALLLSKQAGIHKATVVALFTQGIPGVGKYTKSAVLAFAFNEPCALLETNVRTAFIHHFFPRKKSVSDAELLPLIEKAAEGQDPRTWNWALMDYGAYLKLNGVRNNAKSKHYTKQTKFKGSLREVRGAVLRAVHAGKSPERIPFPKKKIQTALAALKKEGLL